MFACEQSIEIDQNDYTMNLNNNTGIPLEYVEFELKHAKVITKRGYCNFLYINRNIWQN